MGFFRDFGQIVGRRGLAVIGSLTAVIPVGAWLLSHDVAVALALLFAFLLGLATFAAYCFWRRWQAELRFDEEGYADVLAAFVHNGRLILNDDAPREDETKAWQALASYFITDAYGLAGKVRYQESYESTEYSGPLDVQIRYFTQLLDTGTPPRSGFQLEEWRWVTPLDRLPERRDQP